MEQQLYQLRVSNADVLRQITLTGDDLKKAKLYFFNRIELTLPAQTLRERGLFRHCTFYSKNNGDLVYFDYIVKKEFKTLSEWITDCDSTIENVLYGVNRFDNTRSYVELSQICKPVENELTGLMEKLTVEKYSVPDLLVITRNRGVISAPQFLYQ